MAEVFKVWHTGLHRFEAMKSLLPNLGSDTLFVQRFLHEARIAAALSHPHIAAIYNVGPDDAPRPFFTMEFIEGGDLADLFESNGKMSLPQALSLLRPTAEALDYAHARGVVHRDVKPGNILLHTTSRSDWSAKVVDFGIARAQEDQGGTRLTKAGLIVGTPEYMSPEQAGNGQPVDHRTDLYSLGVIAYEMVCGRPPFWAQGNLSSLSVIASHLRDDPPPPRHLEPTLPHSANDAILKALAKNPDDRFSTCAEFIEALTRDVAVANLPSSNAALPVEGFTSKNGQPNATITARNGHSAKPILIDGAADRDTDFIETGSATISTLPVNAPAAPGSVAKNRTLKKWLWPILAALIGTITVIAQFSRGTSSPPEDDVIMPVPAVTTGTSATAMATANATPLNGIKDTTQPTSKPAPIATVLKVADRVRTEVSTQPIKFPVVRRATANLLLGQQRTAQPGKNGERRISFRVTMRDGREIARRVLQVKVLKNSVPQIVLIGTRKATSSASSSRSSRSARRVSQQRRSGATTSSRYNRSTARRSSARVNSTRRTPRRSKRRGNRRESSLPIVESPLP